jgi:hypothetical protein
VTTSWSIPSSPPDGPQGHTCGPFVIEARAAMRFQVIGLPYARPPYESQFSTPLAGFDRGRELADGVRSK